MSNFQERLNRLSDQQKILLAKQITAENNAKEKVIHNFNQLIVAYLTAVEPIEKNELRDYLKGKLPEYMIPSRFVQIEEFPTLPNGKIDPKALKLTSQQKNFEIEDEKALAKNDTEKQLLKIWEDVLGFQSIRRNDNFFEIGGDSILSIQIVSKARKEGIFLAPNQMFEHQTIAELALFAKTENKTLDEEIIVGNVPMLPIQHWFFEEHKNAANHWNQAIIFDVPENLDSDIMQKSVECLVEYHPALRLHFEQTEGEWLASVCHIEDVEAFAIVDLTNVEKDKINSEIQVKSNHLQSNLDLSKSTLIQVVLFNCKQNTKNKLMLFAHHLLVDNISWQIIISDLELIYDQLSRNEKLNLPAKTTSYNKWGNHLIELSKSGEFDKELEFWKEQIESKKIPTDFDLQLPITEESVKIIELEIDSVSTHDLLNSSNETYKTKTEELLLVSLILAFDKWAKIKNLCIGLEKHGRKYSRNDFDLSHSVGWFTTYFPVLLNIADSTNLKESVISIKEKLRSIPNDGLGFGVLRYIQNAEELAQKPQVIFNFLGKQKPLQSNVIGDGKFLTEGLRSPMSERHHLLEINSFVEDNKLRLKFGFSEKLHNEDTIKGLVDCFGSELSKLIEHCSTQKEVVYSPSDFPEVGLNQDDLDNLLDQIS